jgi:hypothetical protein
VIPVLDGTGSDLPVKACGLAATSRMRQRVEEKNQKIRDKRERCQSERNQSRRHIDFAASTSRRLRQARVSPLAAEATTCPPQTKSVSDDGQKPFTRRARHAGFKILHVWLSTWVAYVGATCRRDLPVCPVELNARVVYEFVFREQFRC